VYVVITPIPVRIDLIGRAIKRSVRVIIVTIPVYLAVAVAGTIRLIITGWGSD
jgi:hypothetical protein